MSFNQIKGSSRSRPFAPARKLKPVVRAYDPVPEEAPRSQRRPVVLHGRVVKNGSVDSMSADGSERMSYADTFRARKEAQLQTSVRASMTRKSHFSSLNTETLHYQKMVADLEEILNQSGDSPEMAWRAKILMTSALSTDKELWDKLYQYEKTLLVNTRTNNSEELRMAQSACMKLHRDFKRSHKALVMAISLHEKRRNAEISQLGAVGWSEKDNEDFFDRAMREDEVKNINKSMHQVKEMYEDLGEIVADQQEDIDRLDDNILNASENVRRTTKSHGCLEDRVTCRPDDILGDQNIFGCGGFDYDGFARSISLSMGGDDEDEAAPTKAVGATEDDIRVSEKFHWKMPFETLSDDVKAVKADIMGLGTDIANSSNLKCGREV